MQVYNNVPAFGVWVNYTQSVSNMRGSMGRLSSGLRITTAGEDPAGLAMSERMRAQIRGSATAVQNIQNNQAYMRTADSWMQKIHDILHRMNELAIASNDGTKTDDDRANLQIEFEQMQQEIIRITTGSLARGKFNTQNLFDGGAFSARASYQRSAQGLITQVGADPGQLFCGSPLSLHLGSTAAIGSIATSFGCGMVANEPQAIQWREVLTRRASNDGHAQELQRNNIYGATDESGIHVSTQLGAMRATAILNLAINHLGNQRATIGAESSRLGHSLEGLRTYQENIMSAESQIRDVDFALESTQFMRHQILTQVGTAMLAQANALPQNVLQLIG